MTTRRSTGKIVVARAIWYAKQGVAELRPQQLPVPSTDQVRVKALYSGISRGTERLIFSGQVGPSEYERMRAPLQEGHFPFPVKYGYCAVGTVDIGPGALQGKTVFCLHPHQDVFNAPAGMVLAVPEGIPAKRATLAANAETALNAIWDSGAGPGDRIVIIGAGVVGLMVASIAARLPGAEVTVVDIDETRRGVVESFGARFAAAGEVQAAAAKASSGTPYLDADVVFHTSVNEAGLNLALDCAGMEGTVVELSWYGDKPVKVGLGGTFHSRRLKLISSQVGQVSPGRRPRWNYGRRMAAALRLLDNPALDALVGEEIALEDAPKRMPEIFGPGAKGLAPVIRY